MCGRGEWRAADGSRYVGTFVDDAFDGTGSYTDADGNIFFGGFRGGAFDGAGTYSHADGRAEVWKGGIRKKMSPRNSRVCRSRRVVRSDRLASNEF